MPPSYVDRTVLASIVKQLREIARTIVSFAGQAAEAPREGGRDHTAQFEQVDQSLAEINAQLKKMRTPGDHSAQYREIGAALNRIAAALTGTSTGR